MKSFDRRWLGTSRLPWIGFLLLAFASSSCFGNIVVAGYPAFLGNNVDPNVVIWPVDANGRKFASLATPATQMLREEDRVVTFDWPGDLARSLPDKIGSVTVLLDPAPSVELRARVNELLRNIEQSNPGVNTSITVCALPLGGASDGKSFTAAVERLYAASFDQRSQESLEPLVQLEFLWSSNQRFDERRIVLPNAAIPGEYFLAIGQGSSLERPLFDADFDTLQSVGRQRVLEGVDDRTVVFFLAPWDLQHELEQSMSALMAELSPQPRPGNYATAHWVRWPICYAEFTSLKAVQLTLQGRTSDCTCQYCKAGAEL